MRNESEENPTPIKGFAGAQPRIVMLLRGLAVIDALNSPRSSPTASLTPVAPGFYLDPSNVRVPTTFAFDPTEPFEVSVGFFMFGSLTTWVFARDLAFDAFLTGRAGDGDVRLAARNSLFVVSLVLPAVPTFSVAYDAERVKVFLKKSLAAVDIGSEDISTNIDAALNALLA